MPGLLQTADTDFEQTLADLAHAQLRDKAPALLDFLVGFQVVDRNDDGTHGVGVLGFKVGRQIMLAPVFFLNGELKMSLLFLKNQDLFLPLKDNWVTYLLNRRPAVMGEPEMMSKDRLGIQYPDLTGLSNQRAGEGFSVKLSAAASRTPWMSGAEQMFALMNSWGGDLPDLPSFLAKEAAVRPVFLRTLRGNAALLNATLRVHDWSTLQKACSAPVSSRIRPTAVPTSFKLPASAKRSSVLDRQTALMDASGPHRVCVLYGLDAARRAISDEDRATLLRGDVLVKDAREEANVAYEVTSPKSVKSPSENGVHAILTADGEFKDFFVAVGPKPFSRGFVRSALVIDPETGNFCYAWPETLWAKPSVDVTSGYKSFFDGLSSVDSIEPGNDYVVVTDDLDASVVFAADHKTTKTNGDVVIEITQRIDNPGRRPSMDTHYSARQIASLGSGPAAHAALDRTDVEPELTEFISTRQRNIVVTDKVKRMTPVNTTLFVPRDAKVIKVRSDGDTWPGMRFAAPTAMADLELELLKAGAESLSLAKMSSRFYINGKGPMSYPEALSGLVRYVGLREKQARAMLDEIRDDEACRFLVKNAIGLAPDIPDPSMTQDPYTGADMIMPQDKEIVLDALAAGRQSGYAGTAPPVDQRAMMEAALSGQKEIFDTAAIASLVRTSDSNEMITKYLSDIIRGLDRVCRILFLYYWFNEKFRDRYGQENMIELEDQLKNVVTALGDLVLFLKQRRVESGPMMLDANIDLGRL